MVYKDWYAGHEAGFKGNSSISRVSVLTRSSDRYVVVWAHPRGSCLRTRHSILGALFIAAGPWLTSMQFRIRRVYCTRRNWECREAGVNDLSWRYLGLGSQNTDSMTIMDGCTSKGQERPSLDRGEVAVEGVCEGLYSL